MKIPWKMLVNQWKEKNNQIPWFVFSGLDGSGKTGALERLVAELQESGLRVKTVHLPHDTYLVKTLLNQSMSSYSDRLLFALDNNIVGQKIANWKKGQEYDIIVSQRCWIDFFVHAAVQGFDYKFSAELNGIKNLPEADAVCHLVADVAIAYARIKNDPEGDKFEYPKYMKRQEAETRRAYREIVEGNPEISPYFSKALHCEIDTSSISEIDTFLRCRDFFKEALINQLLNQS